MTEKQKGARAELVHPKFVERWARRYLEICRDRGQKAAIEEVNAFLNPDDAQRVGQEARRLRNLYPNLSPKTPA